MVLEKEWTRVGDKCVKYEEEGATYPDAKSICNSLDSQGKLFEPRNEHENDLVSNLVLKRNGRKFWIGAELYDSSRTFENWAPGQPDLQVDVEDIRTIGVLMWNGKWETAYPDHDDKYYACEKPYRKSDGEGNCDCPEGYFLSSDESCELCQCSKLGSTSCTKSSGQCNCRNNFVGDKCDVCAPGYHGDKCQLFGESEEKIIFTGPCSVNCDNGTQLIMFKDCWSSIEESVLVCSDSIKTRVKPCNQKRCSGTYGEWTAWSACSKTCLQSSDETSQKIRSRLCISEDQSLCEVGCETGRQEIQICNEVGLCPKIGN